MPKLSKKSATLLIILSCIVVIGGIQLFSHVLRQDPEGTIAARTKGKPEAPVHIVEYVDFQCQACAKGARYLALYMNDHPGGVYLELKYFPALKHERSVLSARFAECAARQDKFWAFHDLLIQRQYRWTRLSDARPAVEEIARDAELDMSQLEACMKDPSVEQSILKERKSAESAGIKRTPTYYVNGKMVVGLRSLKQELKLHFEASDH
jgi:protein-disulfide isomerase